MTTPRSTFSLIGDRYLDTQFDEGYIANLEKELAARGVVGLRRCAMECLAAGGLWWNVLWWEWCDFNEKDVVIGWTYNLVLGSGGVAIAAYCVGWPLAGLVGLLLLSLALRVGFLLRKGTVASKPEA